MGRGAPTRPKWRQWPTQHRELRETSTGKTRRVGDSEAWATNSDMEIKIWANSTRVNRRGSRIQVDDCVAFGQRLRQLGRHRRAFGICAAGLRFHGAQYCNQISNLQAQSQVTHDIRRRVGPTGRRIPCEHVPCSFPPLRPLPAIRGSRLPRIPCPDPAP
jgi:hypothetical protein